MMDAVVPVMCVTVHGCQRCGETHQGMEFKPLENAADDWSWWGTCPEKKQPVLLRVEREKVSGKATGFRQSFEKLPDAAQDRVMKLLHKAMMHRGRGGLRDMTQLSLIEEIAELFADNGMEIEQYT